MKVTLEIEESLVESQKQNIENIVGQQNFRDVSKLTLNYKVDWPDSKILLLRLRSLLDLAEECKFELDTEGASLEEFSECVLLMRDLMSLSEKRRNADLWND